MRVGTIIAAIVFAFFAGWDLWEALGNVVGLPAYYRAIEFGEFIPWWILVPGFVLALVTFGGGLWWIIRTPQPGSRILGALIILAASASLQLSVLSAEQAWRSRVIFGLLTGGEG